MSQLFKKTIPKNALFDFLENLKQYLALTKEHQTKTNNEITDRRKLFVGASLFSH
jgi:hypothetical protein